MIKSIKAILAQDKEKLLPNLRHLEDGINFGRSLGVKILAGLQSIDQLNANYSNETKAKNAVSGFSSVFAFHQNDYTTREYISQLMGKKKLFLISGNQAKHFLVFLAGVCVVFRRFNVTIPKFFKKSHTAFSP